MEGAFRSGTTLVGKYRIESLLGRDGMCLVFSAIHLQVGQPVIVKLLVPETVTSLAVHARFLREAQSVARLCGEHVARIVDIGILPEGIPYSVAEAFHGIDLGSEIARRGVLSLSEAIDYTLQACEALAEAHAHGMVHGDIRPATVFLTPRPDGTPLVKVLGFELARTPGVPGQPLARTDPSPGTPGYMAPEQMRPTGELDGRADVWSLGIVLYECLTGRHPFHAESVSLMQQAAVSESPRPLDPGIPRPLQMIVLRCLEKNRDARFPSIADFAAAIAPFAPDQRAATSIVERASFMSQGPAGGFEVAPQGQYPIIAAPTTTGRSPSRARRRYATIGLAVLAVSLSGIAATALIVPDRSQDQAQGQTHGRRDSLVAAARPVERPAPQAVAPATPPAATPSTPPPVQPSVQPPAEPSKPTQATQPPADSPDAKSTAEPAAAKSVATKQPERERPERAERAERAERTDRERPERTERAERTERERPERTAAVASAPSSSRRRNDSCDTVDVDDLMTRAAIQYDAGAATSALSFTRVALGCKQTDRMYWLAVMYACAARDLPNARLYFPKVPANLQSGLETKCQRENMDVRSR
jgi:serine/threonine protein kinase